MAEQHAVGRRKRERVAGRLFPGEMVRLVHQLPRLHAAELRERAVRRLVAPDALRGRQQRIAAVAILIVAVVLIAVDDHLVTDFPAFDLGADRPDDARGIGARDVERMLVPVERRDRNAKAGPDAVVVHATRHHVDEHLVVADRPGRHDFELEGLVGRPVPLLADHPGVHLLRHVAKRRNLADRVQVLERSNAPRLCDGRHRRSPCADHSLTQIMLHRNISVLGEEKLFMAKALCRSTGRRGSRNTCLRVLQCEPA